jgi:hypothetical protein
MGAEEKLATWSLQLAKDNNALKEIVSQLVDVIESQMRSYQIIKHAETMGLLTRAKHLSNENANNPRAD